MFEGSDNSDLIGVNTFFRTNDDGLIEEVDCHTGKIISCESKLIDLPRTYSFEVRDIFCNHIASGMTYAKACLQPNMPCIATVLRWRRSHTDFAKELLFAEQMRAEFYMDKAIDVSDTSGESKLIVDTNKWAAGVSFPDKFGPKSKANIEVKAVVPIMIDTGIRDPNDAGYIKDECVKGQEVLDASSGKINDGDLVASADVGRSGDSSETFDD